MDTVVLLGAGASYGSLDVRPYPPPLGNHLFDALDALGGAASRIPDEIKAEFRRNFEVGMVRYYEYAEGKIMAFHRELAGYLASFEPGPDNAYAVLGELLGSATTSYVSLNYDLLLEESLFRRGHRVAYVQARTPDIFEVVKIHGSCNFWPFLGNNIFIGCEAGMNLAGDVGAPVVPIGRDETLRRCAGDEGFAPAIAMYAEGKDVRVCRDAIRVHQERWESLVNNAKRIIVIGVRVNPVDAHIWGVVANAGAAITYFGLEGDLGPWNDWVASVSRDHATFHLGTFADAIAKLRDETRSAV